MKDLVNDWNNQLVLLLSIAESHNHRLFIQHLLVVLKVYRLNYFMRLILGISQFLYHLKETVRNKFIPAITQGHICSNNEQNYCLSQLATVGWLYQYSMNYQKLTLKVHIKSHQNYTNHFISQNQHIKKKKTYKN